ncbi:MAG: ferrichrome ABC transporter ATP-binding protein [Novosphingobium sp. 17-62-19]|uniref:ABC transporter ATP-binding protein n=1 Tax=Novosphingobium sp. 17-62-19 TaxID=1970406 RepID=UPI000BC9884D|nr:ABC transporter ATP-binding protein [Novosphingobium sp. 17-62-19]OYX95002.1 MAG: ferrichrome ABC transporter ATP-binding protein [Novosphingobium sp. 35-62-5]OZA20240.1 MAG: ferrichrome ABC transporter ATP-binding protein [Novosphingobium sp. 17-62-19]HQS96410.1 ABC transporter ATP-binding protein [Novosphingobium sp.]
MLESLGITIPHRLHDVTAQLQAGRVTAICGPNGAGKSTLLAALAGLITPTSGTVTLQGQPVAQLLPEDRARRIGYLPQSGEVAWNLSVRTLAGLGRLPHRTSTAENAQVVGQVLATLDLTPLADRPLATLSGGERARALLARVLATQPHWILADEPLAALDLSHQRNLAHRFRALAEEGRGVVLVVHDLALAMNHADHVIVLDQGRVAAQGKPETALSEDVIAKVWNLESCWLGEPGHMALAL